LNAGYSFTRGAFGEKFHFFHKFIGYR